MHNHRKRVSTRYQQLKTKYLQMLQRLQSAVSSGQFAQWSRHKQTQLKRRLQRYERRIQKFDHKKIQTILGTGLLATLVSVSNPSDLEGQTFEVVDYSPNAFGIGDIGRNSNPTFIDIDGDGDLDAFIGDESGKTIFFKNVSAVSLPEIAIEGNSMDIPDGDTSPAATNDTDFCNAQVAGGTVSKTFTIKNTGAGALALSGTPLISIDNTTDFMVTSQPSASTITANGMLTFTIQFDPVSIGTKMTTITIANNDSDENPFNFAIQGSGVSACPTDINSIELG